MNLKILFVFLIAVIVLVSGCTQSDQGEDKSPDKPREDKPAEKTADQKESEQKPKQSKGIALEDYSIRCTYKVIDKVSGETSLDSTKKDSRRDADRVKTISAYGSESSTYCLKDGTELSCSSGFCVPDTNACNDISSDFRTNECFSTLRTATQSSGSKEIAGIQSTCYRSKDAYSEVEECIHPEYKDLLLYRKVVYEGSIEETITTSFKTPASESEFVAPASSGVPGGF